MSALRNFEESPTEFSRRMGIAITTFSRKVRLPRCPQDFEALEGRTGRIIRLRASIDLENFMRNDVRSARQQMETEAA